MLEDLDRLIDSLQLEMRRVGCTFFGVVVVGVVVVVVDVGALLLFLCYRC